MQVKLKLFYLDQNPRLSTYSFRISGQQVERINKVKYLGLVVTKFLEWRTHFTHLKKKLNRAIGLLSKICHHTSQNLLKPSYIYFSKFNKNKNKNNDERVENPKIKRLYYTSKILFEKDSLTNKGMTSFNKIFQQSTSTQHYQNIYKKNS